MNFLADTLKDLLKKDFPLVLRDTFIQKKETDIICSKNNILSAITVLSNPKSILQSLGLLSTLKSSVHKIYIALPARETKKITNEKKFLKQMGIGLISFTANNYTIILESGQNHLSTSHLKKILTTLHLQNKIRTASTTYKALSHPTRLEIYLRVSATGTAHLKDIAEDLGGCYPLIMKHVKILEQSNLIESEKIRKETTLKLKSSPVTLDDMMASDMTG